MAEWLKALAWKACIRETVSWVRIPLPPPAYSALRLVYRELERPDFKVAAFRNSYRYVGHQEISDIHVPSSRATLVASNGHPA